MEKALGLTRSDLVSAWEAWAADWEKDGASFWLGKPSEFPGGIHGYAVACLDELLKRVGRDDDGAS